MTQDEDRRYHREYGRLRRLKAGIPPKDVKDSTRPLKDFLRALKRIYSSDPFWRDSLDPKTRAKVESK